ncbi:hypothetical protein [Bdellovibrio sp. HCB-162]|uniref:hypothetical protein n=1 Tax=Bdellovibrio sp. HCB-162 TaxID=3394234 RepID=UPI0039BCE7AB
MSNTSLRCQDVPKKSFAAGATKLEIAGIQITAAIQMMYEGIHPVAIHTVASSAFQIVRDLGSKQGSRRLDEIELRIADGQKGRYYKEINKFWTFFKHANSDPDATFPENVDESINDFALRFAIFIYEDLGGSETLEIRSFKLWFMGVYLDLFKEEVKEQLGSYRPSFESATRADLINMGKLTLRKLKQQEPSFKKV